MQLLGIILMLIAGWILLTLVIEALENWWRDITK